MASKYPPKCVCVRPGPRWGGHSALQTPYSWIMGKERKGDRGGDSGKEEERKEGEWEGKKGREKGEGKGGKGREESPVSPKLNV